MPFPRGPARDPHYVGLGGLALYGPGNVPIDLTERSVSPPGRGEGR